ncbi:MAG: hypothetical protein R3F56_26475 [Planctomycetota bacterium]
MRFTSLFTLAFVPALAAQSYYAQPVGYEGVEGNSSTGIPFSYLSARVQQGDANRIGNPMPAINAIAFRRDRLAGSSSTARAVDVTVLMGKCNIGAFTNTFDNNWLSTPTTVYAQRTTNLPDISTSVPPPGPFVVTFPLDAPFNYDGIDSLLWEMRVDNGVTGTYSLDWSSAAINTAGATSTALGTGCTTPNGAMSLTTSFTASITDLNLSFSTLRAASNAPVVLALGLSDPNLGLPSLCTALRTDALLTLPLGVSGATGSLSSQVVTLPWNNSYAGLDLFTQVLSPDATQASTPIAFSNGRQSPLPLTRGGAAPSGVQRTYSTTSSSAMTGITPTTTAVVTLLTY